jgi:hypothetical protein
MKKQVDKKKSSPVVKTYFDMYAGSKTRHSHGEDRPPRTFKLKVKLGDLLPSKNVDN